MNYLLQNLKPLRNAMRERGWVVTCFDFVYKKQGYYVTVTDYVKGVPKPDRRALVALRFMRKSNLSESLSTWANVLRIYIADRSQFRNFFGIEDKSNDGDIVQQFSKQFGQIIPRDIVEIRNDQKKVILRQLDISDSQDLDKIYCIGVKRDGLKANGEPAERSPFNSQKTQFLRPKLYEWFHSDKNISFRYSLNQIDEKSDKEIIDNFVRREARELRRK
ncbi:DUF6037 family protein [Actinomyces oris]|uniref:DUF6037 family protein n=1 Tax=Actinomyces oris TaxID=544580 RepID=UPI00094D486C|nr:DUF6037 family protein [Actinomyces oris]OLO68915.1 hypothetical protein BKH19_11010 [Actinomyces oris]